VRERRLAETRRTAEKDVLEHVTALLRSLDKNSRRSQTFT
jgi:hypothetical protein